MMRRVAKEHRRFVGVLLAALVVNLGVYVGIVYPLITRVADADNRAAAATRARQEAKRELDAAVGIARSRQKAETELATFYKDVLPADLDGAHKLTYLDLAVRARQHNLRVVRRSEAPAHDRGSGFGHLDIDLTLEGQYEDMRRFIYGLEKAPAFVIISNVALDTGRTQDRLVMFVQLSTYYRMPNDAS